MTTFERAQRQSDEAQRQLYLVALRVGEGDIQKAANLMGMSRATFYRRLKQFDLNREASNMRYEHHN